MFLAEEISKHTKSWDLDGTRGFMIKSLLRPCVTRKLGWLAEQKLGILPVTT